MGWPLTYRLCPVTGEDRVGGSRTRSDLLRTEAGFRCPSTLFASPDEALKVFDYLEGSWGRLGIHTHHNHRHRITRLRLVP